MSQIPTLSMCTYALESCAVLETGRLERIRSRDIVAKEAWDPIARVVIALREHEARIREAKKLIVDDPARAEKILGQVLDLLDEDCGAASC